MLPKTSRSAATSSKRCARRLGESKPELLFMLCAQHSNAHASASRNSLALFQLRKPSILKSHRLLDILQRVEDMLYRSAASKARGTRL
jgi:hypothetical protein